MGSGCREQDGHADYVAGCEPCAARHRKQYAARKGDGYEPPTDSAPVLAHVAKLRAAGMSDSAIVNAAGLSSCALWRLRRNPRCYARTARSILAVPVPRNLRPADAVDLATVAQHIKGLLDAGMMLRDIAAEVPMHPDTLSRYMSRRDRLADWVDAATARKIMAVEPRRSFRGHLVDVTGTRRRLRAMAVDGHGLRKVRTATGIRHNTLIDVANNEAQVAVGRELAEKVARLYDEWIGLPGTLQAATAARGKGWLGPERWTGLDMDDPAVQPHPEVMPDPDPEPAGDPDDDEYGPIEPRKPDEIDYVNVQHAVDGYMFRDELTTAELVEVVRRLARRGMPDNEIHAHLRWTPDYATVRSSGRSSTVGNWRRYHGIPQGTVAAYEEWSERRRQRERYLMPAGLVYRRPGDGPPATAGREERDAHNAAIIARAS